MYTRLVAFYTAFVIFLGTFALCSEPKIPTASTEEQLMSVQGVIEKKQLGDEIYAIDVYKYSYEEKLTAIALQGIVAKKNPCIYYITNGVDRTYLSEIEKSGTKVTYKSWTLEDLLEKFSSYIGDSGYILYRESEYGEGLNVATSYATAYGWLPVQKNTEALAKKYGLTLKKDISEDTYNLEFQQKHWEALQDYFKKGVVVHEKYKMPGLRDLAIQQNIYCFYTDSTDNGDKYLKKVLTWSGKNTSVQGWTEDEKGFVSFISELGCYINPADICWNNSVLASVNTKIPDINTDDAVAYSDADKHYVTLVFSDGDNCQWIQNGFGEYRTAVSSYPDMTMTWTVSPFFQELNPLALKLTYDKANENQCFISGPSGVGYCNPACYDKESLDLMSTRTAAAMLKSKQRILTILDDYTLLKDAKFGYRLGFYSRFDNIDGGILFLDPNGYRGGKGKVWFSNDKPFASVRMSLWADEGNAGATDEWIRSKADIINNYPIDISSINGYSVICVHAWTMKPASIQKFIDCLDDHVVVLNADDFLKTMQVNIPHTNAAPVECYE